MERIERRARERVRGRREVAGRLLKIGLTTALEVERNSNSAGVFLCPNLFMSVCGGGFGGGR